jgi:hypothetical protein
MKETKELIDNFSLLFPFLLPASIFVTILVRMFIADRKGGQERNLIKKNNLTGKDEPCRTSR